tara:strand:+ start:5635 stop:6819 length:1185 start_codon:yes stop_codon:yes gene_type:complete
VTEFDVIIIGGGAAGLMCAATAAERGRRVLVLEGSNRIGKKILMSGGGRCNFTNLYCTPDNFISANPKFCTSAISRYTQWDFIALVEKYGIAYHEKTRGQLFCDESSKQIVAMLQRECERHAVQILTNCRVSAVDHATAWEVRSNKGEFVSESLVLATGGLSIPKMGASDFGYRLARQFGLAVRDTRAGLVPFTFSGAAHEMSERLAGVSVASVIECGAVSFDEDLLFTHRGLSGPAALQISSYWMPGDDIELNLMPAADAAQMLLQAKAEHPRSRLRTVLTHHLPRALVLELQALFWPDSAETAIGELPNARLQSIAQQLQRWTLRPAATEGYRTAEVTLGGIDTDELSSQTMACKRQPSLYCIGELVDVTGHLGGFNFQWAWASGHAAGRSV